MLCCYLKKTHLISNPKILYFVLFTLCYITITIATYVPTLTKAGHIERNNIRRRALFELVVTDKKFETGYVLATIYGLKKRYECPLECLDVPGCQSVNYQYKKYICELLGFDRNTEPDNATFITASDWLYYDTGFDITLPVWRKKSLLKLECNASPACDSSFCGCIKEPGNNKEHCECWTVGGQLRFDGTLCARADTNLCSASDGMAIELQSDCSGLETEFEYNPDIRNIRQKCTKKPLCPDNLNPLELIRVNSNCPICGYCHWGFGLFGELLYGRYALELYNSQARLDNALQYVRTRPRFEFARKVEGRVQLELFEGCTATYIDCFDNRMVHLQPSHMKNIYNLDSGYYTNYLTDYGIRGKTYFVAPTTGNYYFTFTINQAIRLYLGTSRDESTKTLILGSALNTAYDNFRYYYSPSQYLTANNVYYLEFQVWEKNGNSYYQVGVRLPDGTDINPITQKYLIAYP